MAVECWHRARGDHIPPVRIHGIFHINVYCDRVDRGIMRRSFLLFMEILAAIALAAFVGTVLAISLDAILRAWGVILGW